MGVHYKAEDIKLGGFVALRVRWFLLRLSSLAASRMRRG
jgi:hypothetical protein